MSEVEQQQPPVSSSSTAPATAATSTADAERQRVELTCQLLDPNLKPAERAEKLRELRATLAGMETPDEKAERESGDVREQYGLKDPQLYRNNREWLQSYDQEYRGREAALGNVAHSEGFDGARQSA